MTGIRDKRACKNEITDKFRKIPTHLKVVSLGTTQCHYAIDFVDMGLNGFNMALYKTPVEFHVQILRRYGMKIAPDARILITLQYPIFVLAKVKEIAYENIQQYARVIPWKNRYVPLYKQALAYLSKQEENDQMRIIRDMDYREEHAKYRNHLKPWELERLSSGLLEYGWNVEVGIPGYVQKEHRNESAMMKEVMEYHRKKIIELIGYCEEKGWKPILVGLPYSSAVNERVPETFKQKCFYENVEKVCAETACPFWDYSADEQMTDINNFLEIQFLNSRGRKRFASVLSERLKQTEQIEKGSDCGKEKLD